MKKNDLKLIAGILLVALVVYGAVALYQNKTTKTENGLAVVYIDGEKYAQYSLNVDAKYVIELGEGRYNHVVISGGYATVSEASCPDKICVKHRKINKNMQTITCPPNRLVVQIENAAEEDIDAVSQ